MSSKTSSSVPAVDGEEGTVLVPANGEASLRMALDFGCDIEVADSDEWYLAGMRESAPIREALAALDFESPNGDDDEERDEATFDDMSDSEMLAECDGYSRDFTEEPQDGDDGHPCDEDEDDWTLERILKRRNVRSDAADSATTMKREATDETLVSAVPQEYLCKWRGYDEPTWEPRELLEEEGFVRLLNEYDRLHAGTRPRRKLAPKEPKPPVRLGAAESIMGDGFLGRVLELAAKANARIRRFARVNNAAVERRFLNSYRSLNATHCPMVLFHGTRILNIPSIAAHGLIVPGKHGVRVLNGSSYGVGIYAAKNMGYSMSYTDTNKMFVCLGLVGPQYPHVKEVADIVVFSDESMIVPLWVVEYENAPRLPGEALAELPECVSMTSILGRQMPAYDALPSTSVVVTPARGALLTRGGREIAQARANGATKRLLKKLPRRAKDMYASGMLPGK